MMRTTTEEPAAPSPNKKLRAAADLDDHSNRLGGYGSVGTCSDGVESSVDFLQLL